jgi:hypothetical protein
MPFFPSVAGMAALPACLRRDGTEEKAAKAIFSVDVEG